MKLDKFFKKSKIDEAKREAQSLKGRETLVYITPRDFLKLAPELSHYAEYDGLKDLAEKGVQFSDVPYFKTDPKSNNVFKIQGHEGRHRCLALVKMNVRGKIPVRIIDLTTRWLEDGYYKKSISLEAETGSFKVEVDLHSY